MKFEFLLASLVASAWLAPQTPSASGGLIRVTPSPTQAQQPRAEMRSGEPIAVDAWRDRLTSPDLDARMLAFDQLAQLGASDPQVRTHLRQWSLGQDELAWTARLLLRETDRAPAMRAAPGIGLWRVDPFAGEPWGELERRLEELWKLRERSSGLWTSPPPAGASSSSAKLEFTPEGVKVRITEELDGQQTTREYTAATLEDLFAAHPELREQIAIGALDDSSRTSGFGPRFDWFLGSPRQDQHRVPSPRAKGAVRTDILGVVLEELSADQRTRLGLSDGVGLRIVRVEAGTIAEQMALKPGHVLLELDGEPVRSRDDVTKRIGARAEDSEVRAVYLDRWGQRQEARWRQQNARSI